MKISSIFSSKALLGTRLSFRVDTDLLALYLVFVAVKCTTLIQRIICVSEKEGRHFSAIDTHLDFSFRLNVQVNTLKVKQSTEK